MSGHGPHADATDPFQKRAAVAIAIFTVILAFANMLTNQARTKAILSSNRATNQWAYYQSKSTKLLLTQMRHDFIAKLGNGATPAELEALEAEVARYELDKEAIRKRAEGFAGEEADSEHKEHFYEYSATLIELGIVLAGIALLMSSRKLLAIAAVLAVCSLGLVAFTTYGLGHAEHAPAEPGDAAKPAH